MKIGLVNLVPDEDAPPINLAHLATCLMNTGLKKIKIIDPTYEKKIFFDQICELDLVGISSMTPSYSKAIKLAKQIKKECNIPIIIGGTHISLVPESLTREFSIGIIGEGEQALVELCHIFEQYAEFPVSKLTNVAGLVYWLGDKIIQTPPLRQMENLDDLPIPNFELLSKQYFDESWIDWSGRVGVSMHISTSRGCPYNCVFCSGKRFWQTTRFRSVPKTLVEIKELITRYGVDHIVIDDDLFLSNKRRLNEFARLMEEDNLSGRVVFLCNARSNLIDDDICMTLKRIGVRSMNFGFESGSNKILKYLKGYNVTVEQNKNAIKLCREYDFEVSGNLIFGSPAETIEDMIETLKFMDFAIKMGCYKIGAFVLTPLPGTPMWDIAKARGLVNDNMDWDLLSFYNYKNGMLLDPKIERERFEALFKMVRNKSYRAWLTNRNRWRKMLRYDTRRVLRKVIEDPTRALVMCKNLFQAIL